MVFANCSLRSKLDWLNPNKFGCEYPVWMVCTVCKFEDGLKLDSTNAS